MNMERNREKTSAERPGEAGVSRREFLTGTGIVVGSAALGVLGVLSACKSETAGSKSTIVTKINTAAPATASTTLVSTQTANPLVLLKTNPERGPAGTSITLTGGGLPPGKTAEIIWVTVDGKYDTRQVEKK